MRAIVAAAALALLAFAPPAFAQSLTGDQIMSTWGDRTVDATLPNGNRMKLLFRRNGTIEASGAASDRGVWKTQPDGYCTKWTRFNNAEERCFTVVRRADGGFTVRGAGGALSAEVAPLN